MPLLAVDEVGVFRRGFLPADFSLRGRDIRRVAVGRKRRRGALRHLAPLVLWLLEGARLMLVHRAHRLQPLDRVTAYVPVPVAEPRRVRGFQAMRGLEPGLGHLMRAYIWTHGHRRAIETVMLIQEAAGHRRGNNGIAAANRGCARVCGRDRALQDRSP